VPSREIAPRPDDADVAALYVHVPFCAAKCRYCDFYSVPHDEGAVRGYLDALATELALRGGCLLPALETIFVGGGTPTSLSADSLARLLGLLQPLAGEQTEFTVEANPGTIDADKAALLAAAGVNRVSLGVQSLDAGELALLGRIHSPSQATDAVELLRCCLIDNLSVDLIYGIPGQTPAGWRDTLARAATLPVSHVSTYGLTFEEGTPLHRDLLAGRVSPMPEERQRACYYEGAAFLEGEGLGQYEISNFARPGRRCRHNLTYWRNEAYLGLGPGAASYVGGCRGTNAPDLDGYVASLLAGALPPCQSERLTGRKALAEALMLGLRLIEGVDRRAFARRYGLDPVDAFPTAVDKHRRIGSLLVDDSCLRLSNDYLYVSDSVIADILAES
jgi:oxygen-independent coproporphyrinogen-3 oxidase